MLKHLLSAYVTVTPLLGIAVLSLVSSRMSHQDAQPWPLVFLIAYLVTAAIVVIALLRWKHGKVLSGWFGVVAVAVGLLCLTFIGDRGNNSSDIRQIITVAGIAITIGVSMLYFAFKPRIPQGSHTKLTQTDENSAAKPFNHRGKVIQFDHTTGEVIGTNKFSETHVTSSGGGGTVSGYVGPYGGHVGGNVSAPVVTSHAITKHEFWIRTDEGEETPVKLAGVDIPLLAGQRITIYLARNINEPTGWYCILVNHSAGKHWFINSGSDLNGNLRVEVFSRINFVIAVGVYVAAVFTIDTLYPYPKNDAWIIGLALSGAFLVFSWIRTLLKANAVAKKLQQHLESIAQATYKNAAQSSSFTAADALKAAKAAQASGQTGVVSINIDNM